MSLGNELEFGGIEARMKSKFCLWKTGVMTSVSGKKWINSECNANRGDISGRKS